MSMHVAEIEAMTSQRVDARGSIGSGTAFGWPQISRAELCGPNGASEWRDITAVLAAADELSSCRALEPLLKRAVELARECIGLERVGLYIQDPPGSRTFRGTYGTGAHGEITEEHELRHEIGPGDCELMLQVQNTRARWLYFDHTRQTAQSEPGKSAVIGRGWLVVTPLVSGGELVGVIYNDTALSHSPMDDGQQVQLAVFASLLANLIAARRNHLPISISTTPDADCGPAVQRVVNAVNHDPLVSARVLAREMSISAGHLTRLFRTEMGMSLVEYRNRLRIQRFFGLVEKGGDNLLAAALAAGFGSYAQFHRVFRRVVGTTPREYIVGQRSSGDGEAQA